MRVRLCLLTCFLAWTALTFAEWQAPCDFVSVGDAGVCRCTAQYCDEIQPLGTLLVDQIAVYRSTKEGERLTRLDNSFVEEPATEAHVMTVDVTKHFQKVLGFGGAFTDAAAININSLNDNAQERLMESYYSEKGLEYTLGRVPIASCDFSTHVYSYDDVEGDVALEHFSIDMDRPLKIPLIQRALNMSKRHISLFASSWSPPAWMTEENTTVGGHLKGGPSSELAQSYGRYISKFFDAYKAEGIDFWGLTVANEPVGNPISKPQWQDLLMTAEEQAAFVRDSLGPAVKESHPEIKLMMLDDQRPHIPKWTDTVLRDKKAASYIDGIAIHWYMALEDLLDNFRYVGYAHEHHPDKFILATEACTGYLPIGRGPKPGSWRRAEDYIKDIIGDVLNWSTGWTDWNIALDLQGGPNWAKNWVDAPILINTTDGNTFYKNPMFYAMGHFSKFVPEGSIRIEIGGSNGVFDKDLPSVAFLTPDGKIAVVIHNSSPFFERTISLHYPSKGYMSTVLPKRSFATFVWMA